MLHLKISPWKPGDSALGNHKFQGNGLLHALTFVLRWRVSKYGLQLRIGDLERWNLKRKA